MHFTLIQIAFTVNGFSYQNNLTQHYSSDSKHKVYQSQTIIAHTHHLLLSKDFWINWNIVLVLQHFIWSNHAKNSNKLFSTIHLHLIISIYLAVSCCLFTIFAISITRATQLLSFVVCFFSLSSFSSTMFFVCYSDIKSTVLYAFYRYFCVLCIYKMRFFTIRAHLMIHTYKPIFKPSNQQQKSIK